MGFEGRSRDRIERELSGAQPAVGAPMRPTGPRKVAPSTEPSDGAIKFSVGMLAYVVIFLLFPLFLVDCGTFGAQWSGIDLATGAMGSPTGLAADAMPPGMAQMTGSDMPSDGLLFLFPLLAIGAIAMALQRAHGVATVLAAGIVGLFAWYATAGFAIERDLEKDLPEMEQVMQAQMEEARSAMAADPRAQGMDPTAFMQTMPSLEMKRTNWFWAGLVVSVLALLALLSGRARGLLGPSPPG